jgi:hypothetical protein
MSSPVVLLWQLVLGKLSHAATVMEGGGTVSLSELEKVHVLVQELAGQPAQPAAV